MKLPQNLSPVPVTWVQAVLTGIVLGATLVLGLEKILASEAVASIFTAALGYVYTAGAVERASRTRESADRVEAANNSS
jgi:hypothetical protein